MRTEMKRLLRTSIPRRQPFSGWRKQNLKTPVSLNCSCSCRQKTRNRASSTRRANKMVISEEMKLPSTKKMAHVESQGEEEKEKETEIRDRHRK
ncbi:FAM85B isoform 2 [Pan troglodytes]|uniref:FAM85B isoform 2 n=1 Tax=Pan troglodytes TaxID=9598 RepID=A0A2J8Q9H1_PANTR|nr:FAM85B isoform 2 [Pan troglodytes]